MTALRKDGGGSVTTQKFSESVGISNMTNFKKAALAATIIATAFGASPALAAGTSASANGSATVKIYSPLSIAAATAADSVVDFGILVGTRLTGAAPRSANAFVIDPLVGPSAASVCGTAANWSCSGSPHRAKYTVNGSDSSVVNVWLTASSIVMLRAGGSAVVTDDTIPLDLTLSETADSNADGNMDFVLAGGTHDIYVGGSLGVSASDNDGVYTGSFQINADYQ